MRKTVNGDCYGRFDANQLVAIPLTLASGTKNRMMLVDRNKTLDSLIPGRYEGAMQITVHEP